MLTQINKKGEKTMSEIEVLSTTANRLYKKLPLVRNDTNKYDEIFFEELGSLLNQVTRLINLKGEQNNA